MEKKLVYFSISLLIISLMAVTVSASIFDKLGITGMGSSQTHTVTAGVKGSAQAYYVSDTMASVTLTEFGNAVVTFNIVWGDSNGVDDLNDGSADVFFYRGGTTIDGSCSWVSDSETDPEATYSCSVTMPYYSIAAADWNLNATITDYGNLTAVVHTEAFTVNQLQSLNLSVTAVTFGTLDAGSENNSATSNPLVIYNGGNWNGPIKVTAKDLTGASNPANYIGADSFKVDYQSTGCDGAWLSLNAETIPGGNATVGNGASNNADFCAALIATQTPTDTYSATGGNSWTVAYAA